MPRLPRHQRTASQGGEKKLIIHDIVCVCVCVLVFATKILILLSVRTFLGGEACPKACLRVKTWFKVKTVGFKLKLGLG